MSCSKLTWWDHEDVNDAVVEYYHDYARYPRETLDWLKKQVKPLLDQYVAALARRGVRCRIEYTGSVAEGVRIQHTDGTLELDVEFVMEAPFVHVTPLDEAGCCNLIDPSGQGLVYLPGSFIGKRGHVSAERVRELYDAVFDEVMPSWQSVFQRFGCVIHKVEGPAVKVKVAKKGKPWLYVDLVPAIQGPGGGCYVPKQRPHGHRYIFAWRESFSLEERDQYPDDCPWAKPCLRILKSFCASNLQMKRMETYILKNLLFLEVDERPSNSWDEEDVGRRLLGLLVRLRKGLRDGFIPQFFNQGVNLLRTTSASDMTDMQLYINTLLCRKQAFLEDLHPAN